MLQARAAGVAGPLILTAEATLEEHLRKEESQMSKQVSSLYATLDKLHATGAQAAIAHSRLAQAGKIEADVSAAKSLALGRHHHPPAAAAAGGSSSARAPPSGASSSRTATAKARIRANQTVPTDSQCVQCAAHH